MMYSMKDRGRHTWKKGTRSAPNSSRTYDLPNTTERYETLGGVGRLTRSKVTNFSHTARIKMSKVVLLRDDKLKWSILSLVFLM